MTLAATTQRSRRGRRFARHYGPWRKARVNSIRWYYGDGFFEGRSLLELGCGYGDIGAAFARLGARVTCSDAREEHLEVVRRRYPSIRTVCADLDREWPFERFDIVLHLGVLYHLEPTHASLRHACRTARHLVLETEIADSSDPGFVASIDEHGYDQAFGGHGCRPSAARIEAMLADEGMQFERISDGRCNAGFHVYDWPLENSGRTTDGQRRFWFAWEDAGARA